MAVDMETYPLHAGSGCAICGDPAAARHYNVLACTGCKTFFRRAIIKRRVYTCEGGAGSCKISANARKACRKCRFDKCLYVGMRKEALHPRRDLIPVRVACNSSPPSTSSCASSPVSQSQPSPPNPLTSEEARLLGIIEDLTRFDEKIRHRKNQVFRSRREALELTRHVSDKPEVFPTIFAGLVEPEFRLISRWDLGHSTQTDLLSMIDWTQAIPCFVTLPPGHRLKLLQQFAIHYLVIECGYYTAMHTKEDFWMLSNGACMPRNVSVLKPEIQCTITADRLWRQEKLYKEMTDSCIDYVAAPFRSLGLLPQELVTLKLIMLFQAHDIVFEELSNGEKATVERVQASRENVIAALFAFYKAHQVPNYDERFGNVILLISGIACAAMALKESYQLMRVFNLCHFDALSEQLLFQKF